MQRSGILRGETSLMGLYKLPSMKDIGHEYGRLIASSLDKGGGDTKPRSKKQASIGAPEGPTRDPQDALKTSATVSYLVQGLNSLRSNLTPDEVASAAMTSLTETSLVKIGNFINHVYDLFGFDDKIVEKSEKEKGTLYRSLIDTVVQILNVFSDNWVTRGISELWTTITTSFGEFFGGFGKYLSSLSDIFNVKGFVSAGLEALFGILQQIASVLTAGFKLVFDQAAIFVKHVYQFGMSVVDRLSNGEQIVNSLFEACRIIHDKLGAASVILLMKQRYGPSQAQKFDDDMKANFPPLVGECFKQIQKLFPSIIGLCSSDFLSTMIMPADEREEKEAVVKDFMSWLSSNSLIDGAMKYMSSAVASGFEKGWKAVAEKLELVFKKVVSVVVKSLALSLSAILSFIGYGGGVISGFLNEMALVSATMTGNVSRRRALKAFDIKYDEDILKLEERGVEDVLNTMSDVDNEASPGRETLVEMISSTQTSFDYRQLLEFAKKHVEKFKEFIPIDSQKAIQRRIREFERVLTSPTPDFDDKLKQIFKSTTPEAREYVRELNDAISYPLQTSDEDFKNTLKKLKTDKNNVVRQGIQVIKSSMLKMEEEMRRSAMALVKEIAAAGNIMRQENDDDEEEEEEEEDTSSDDDDDYEDASSSFKAKAKTNAKRTALNAPTGGHAGTPRGLLETAFYGSTQFLGAMMQSMIKHPLLWTITLATSTLASWWFDTDASFAYLSYLMGPQYYLGGQIVEKYVTPHLCGWWTAKNVGLPQGMTSEQFLAETGKWLSDSVKETIRRLTEQVPNQCYQASTTTPSVFNGYSNERVVSVKDDSGQYKSGYKTIDCVIKPFDEFQARSDAMISLATRLKDDAPTVELKQASELYLEKVPALKEGLIDPVKLADKHLQSIISGVPESAIPLYTELDKQIEPRNIANREFAAVVSKHIDQIRDPEFVEMVSEHLRQNAPLVWKSSAEDAGENLFGKKPTIAVSPDKQSVKADLRLALGSLTSAEAQSNFIWNLRGSRDYGKYIGTNLSRIGEISGMTVIMMRMWTTPMTMMYALGIQFLTHKALEKLLPGFERSADADKHIRANRINGLSFRGHTWFGHAIYWIIRGVSYTVASFSTTLLAEILFQLVYAAVKPDPINWTLTGLTIAGSAKELLFRSLMAGSSMFVAYGLKKTADGFVYLADAWSDRRNNANR